MDSRDVRKETASKWSEMSEQGATVSQYAYLAETDLHTSLESKSLSELREFHAMIYMVEAWHQSEARLASQLRRELVTVIRRTAEELSPSEGVDNMHVSERKTDHY